MKLIELLVLCHNHVYCLAVTALLLLLKSAFPLLDFASFVVQPDYSSRNCTAHQELQELYEALRVRGSYPHCE
jgi:hypothetical protein